MDVRVITAAAAAALLCGAATPASNMTADLAERAATGPDLLANLRSVCGPAKDRAAGLRARLRSAALLVGPATAQAATPTPQLMQGLGGIHYPITTSNPRAQAWFDQGLALTYGFNHHAAIAAFRAAQRLDPQCAMCFWGEAYAWGPNINAPMEPEALPAATAATRRAEALAGSVKPVERALIEALATRYSDRPGADRAQLDAAYGEAMKRVVARFPDDDTVAVLAAEAAMDRRPWDYWEADGRTPKGDVGWAIGTVEKVLARSPNHPQATHLYIHLMEASASPEKAEGAADRLAKPLVPAAGHLVHMPGHLYYRVGRFKDSIRVNRDAVRVDEAFLKTTGERGIYRYGYYPHNVHFLLTSAQMAGDQKTVLEMAARLRRVVDADVSTKLFWTQPIHAAPYFASVQYGTPEATLKMAAPDPRLPYVTAMWRYARAMAYADQKNGQGVARELAAMERIRTTGDFTAMTTAGVPGPQLIELAEQVARGRLAYRQGNYGQAGARYQKAVQIEDALPYMEPPFWYFPVRQSLGAALLKAGKPQEAQAAFLGALARHPNSAWALYGLRETQLRQGDTQGARASEAALRRAWLGDWKQLKLDRL